MFLEQNKERGAKIVERKVKIKKRIGQTMVYELSTSGYNLIDKY